MRLTIERAGLLQALNHVQSVVERRTTIPILSNVLIEAGGGVLSLRATDLDLEAVETAPADVTRDGATTVSAHMFYDIARKLPDGAQVELELGPDEGRLMLTSGRSRFTLQALPAGDFPDLSAGEMSHRFTLDALDLKHLVDHTRFAISTEETRYYLNGIYLHAAETDASRVLRAVATDGHRLAQCEIALPDGAEGMPGIIIPRKTISELHKLVEDGEGSVDIALSDAKIRFKIGSTVLTSKLIDGTFPDYGRVIPSGNDKLLKVDAAAFSQAVDRVSTLSSDKGRAVKLRVEQDRMVLSVNNPDSGSATEEVAAEYNEDAMEIGFNARYLLDIAGQLESQTAEFLMADPGSPTMIRDGEDKSSLYVLMPMRV